MNRGVLITLTVLSACAVLYFAFCLLLTIPYNRREAATESFVFHGAGLAVTALALISCIRGLMKSAGGRPV
jgi:hypothetical protein